MKGGGGKSGGVHHRRALRVKDEKSLADGKVGAAYFLVMFLNWRNVFPDPSGVNLYARALKIKKR